MRKAGDVCTSSSRSGASSATCIKDADGKTSAKDTRPSTANAACGMTPPPPSRHSQQGTTPQRETGAVCASVGPSERSAMRRACRKRGAGAAPGGRARVTNLLQLRVESAACEARCMLESMTKEARAEVKEQATDCPTRARKSRYSADTTNAATNVATK